MKPTRHISSHFPHPLSLSLSTSCLLPPFLSRMLLRSSFYARAIPALGFLSNPRTTMPLRAKILNPAQRMMSTSLPIPVIREQEGDDPNDVLFGSNFGVRTIELNRPSAHNALDGSMARKIVPRLQEWEKSQLANIIILKGAGEKALCSGGDVRSLAGRCNTAEGVQESIDFFGLEYRLDHLIATYKKPYIAFMDGITMGGGVGLSVHAPFRIATERTLLAMPETRIGFFPDVGASFFMPRLDGQVGAYLALTGETLKGVQTLYSGIATHYIHSSSLPDLEQRLSELKFEDYAYLSHKWDIINSTIEEFVTGLPNEPIQLGGQVREAIDRCFSFKNMDQILHALSVEGTRWADNIIAILRSRSPTSLHVTLRLMRLGISPDWTISETFQREYSVAARFMKHPDFVTGVDTLLNRKSLERPEWRPANIEDVTEKQVEEFLTPEPGETRLQLLRSGGVGNYSEYRHAGLGLPSELEVRNAIVENKFVKDDLVRLFVDSRNGKAGVREKVLDVLERKTERGEEGYLQWKY